MGDRLISDLTSSTGLPEEALSNELERLIVAANLKPETLTLDDLRSILAEYLQDVFVEAKEDLKRQA